MKRIFLILLTSSLLAAFQTAAAQEKPKRVSCDGCGRKPIYLAKPVYPKTAKFRPVGTVRVEILIDEKGNVESAKVISGHPLFRAEAIRAALKSKFEPLKISGKFVKAPGIIVYNFIPSDSNQTKQTIEKPVKKGIINAMASYLPKPEYSQEAKDLCAGGKVEVEVVFKNSEGEVVSARAVSGDELLRKSAEEAALKAKFFPIDDVDIERFEGVIVYNFPPEKKCIDAGIVNKKAAYLPKPFFNGKIVEDFEVKVRVLIDTSTGKVLAAKADAGHPLIRTISEKAALETKFSPAFINGAVVYVKGIIIYKFKTDGTIETNFPKKSN